MFQIEVNVKFSRREPSTAEETVVLGTDNRPTKFLTPEENRKGLAQFFFDEKTIAFLISQLQLLHEKFGLSKVCCVGTPCLHEELYCLEKSEERSEKKAIQSMLFDLDPRFRSFSPERFQHFNLCNFHSFDENSKATGETWLEHSNLLLIDPPYGIRADIIARCIRKISQRAVPNLSCVQDLFYENCCGKKDVGAKSEPLSIIPFLWFFPHYFAARVKQLFPNIQVLDYVINYRNHPLFSKELESSEESSTDSPAKACLARRNKRTISPVRIFTNICLCRFQLAEKDYRFCRDCYRWTDKSCKHCDMCKKCPENIGKPMRHCDLCNCCVRATFQHCMECNSCQLPDKPSTESEHMTKCNQHTSHKRPLLNSPGCFACGSLEHHQRDCNRKHEAKRQKVVSEANEKP